MIIIAKETYLGRQIEVLQDCFHGKSVMVRIDHRQPKGPFANVEEAIRYGHTLIEVEQDLAYFRSL